MLEALAAELDCLTQRDDIETTLLIIPGMLRNFEDFNAFLDSAEALLREMDLEGIYQLAHFHPDYQFAGTHPDDAENYTNRSPYPILHLLREESLDRVLETTEFAEAIPERNIALMNELGAAAMQERLEACSSQERSSPDCSKK